MISCGETVARARVARQCRPCQHVEKGQCGEAGHGRYKQAAQGNALLRMDAEEVCRAQVTVPVPADDRQAWSTGGAVRRQHETADRPQDPSDEQTGHDTKHGNGHPPVRVRLHDRPRQPCLRCRQANRAQRHQDGQQCVQRVTGVVMRGLGAARLQGNVGHFERGGGNDQRSDAPQGANRARAGSLHQRRGGDREERQRRHEFERLGPDADAADGAPVVPAAQPGGRHGKQ